MMSRGKRINLVRLWNPWGTGEWNRDWSDRMSLEDLCEFYTDLDICSLSPDYLDGNSSCHWKTYMNDGRWVAGTTAGGYSYWTNPQYRVKIGCQSLENNGEKNVLVSLMQKPDKRNRHLVQSLHIGIKVKDDMLSLMALRYGASSGHLTLTASSVSSSASNACT
ncbi:Calpain-3, partial [Dissostichus eleginoides]